MNFKELNGVSIRDAFDKFHKDNPHIYLAFENQVMKAIERGREKISAKLIINWIRWNMFIESNDISFRINDAYQAYYAREFVKHHPEHANIFEFRKLRNEETGPYIIIEDNGQLSFL